MNAGSTANYSSGYQAGLAATNPVKTAIAKTRPYGINSNTNPTVNSRIAQFRSQINTKASIASTTISKSGGFGSMGHSSGGD